MATQINGTTGNDDLRGSSASESFQGFAGNDTIWAWEGDDILDGGIGDDYLDGGQDHDLLYGGEGDDKLYGDRNFGIAAGNGSDILYGGMGNDYLNGGDGDDILDGEEDNDTLEGKNGNDFLYGGSGEDILRGENGNDIVYGELGDDTLDGGDGDDHLDGDLDGDPEVIFPFLGSAKDIINGGKGNDLIWAGEDNDTVDGGGGTDTIYGESGNDYLFGGISSYIQFQDTDVPREFDSLDGGNGNDTLVGGTKKFIYPGTSGNDSYIENNDVLQGGEEDDILYGDYTAKTQVVGNAEGGNDRIYGGNNSDMLYGGIGSDTLIGGEGDDYLFGGPTDTNNKDVLEGGPGVDVFLVPFSDQNGSGTLSGIINSALGVAKETAKLFSLEPIATGFAFMKEFFSLSSALQKKLPEPSADTVWIKDFSPDDLLLLPKSFNSGWDNNFSPEGTVTKSGEVFYKGVNKLNPFLFLEGSENGIKLDTRYVSIEFKEVPYEVIAIAGSPAAKRMESLREDPKFEGFTRSHLVHTDSDSGNHIVGGYYPEWGTYDRNFQVADVPADKLTHLFYAFAQIDQNGKTALFDPWASKDKPFSGDVPSQELKGNLNQLRILKEQHPNLKNMLSIGGWSLSGPFSTVASTPESRQAFAKSAVELMTKYRTSDGRPIFDGIDIDWEHPVSGGASMKEVEDLAPSRANTEVKNSPADKQNYVLLLEALRNELDKQGSDYQLTIASAAGAETVKNLDLKGISKYVDFFNVMAYDFHGSTWQPNQTNHQAALYGSGDDDVDSAIQTYVNEADSDPNDSFDRSDIVMGAPLYGRGWVGVPSSNDGLLQPANGTASGTWERGIFDYKDLHNRLQTQPGAYKEVWDNTAKVPYIYSPTEGGMFSTYENVRSIGAKTDYIRYEGLGGMFFWELSGDLPSSHPDSLVSKAASALGVSS
jgi:GH18 family chitinase/Ca2+-binding RTX toxin-like protein